MAITTGCKVDNYLAAYDVEYDAKWYRLYVNRHGRLFIVSIPNYFDCFASWSSHYLMHFAGRYSDITKAWEVFRELTKTVEQDIPPGIMEFIRRLAIKEMTKNSLPNPWQLRQTFAEKSYLYLVRKE